MRGKWFGIGLGLVLHRPLINMLMCDWDKAENRMGKCDETREGQDIDLAIKAITIRTRCSCSDAVKDGILWSSDLPF